MILEMELLSDAIPGSGEGLAGIIDIDVARDEYGIPYIPAKRIKGVLRESALELENTALLHGSVDDIFGSSGKQEGTAFKISDGYIENYDIYKKFLEYASQNVKLAPLFNREIILDGFTYQRSRTTIDHETFTAKENTLRTSRVLKQGLKFYFHVEFPLNSDDNYQKDLEKICKATRRFGLSRTRGLGEIHLCFLNKSFLGGSTGGSILQNGAAPQPSLHGPRSLPSLKTVSQAHSFEVLVKSSLVVEDKKLILSIENKGQLMVTSKTGKKQFSETYIPGSALLGVFANSYIKYHSLTEPHQDTMFRDIFLAGKVTFSNAYPAKKNYNFIPTPLSIHKEKDKDNYFNLSQEKDFQEVLNDEITSKPLSQEFSQIDVNNNFTPYPLETCIEYHHSRPEDKSIGHAGEGNGVFFQYSVLKAEENFRAEVEGPFDLLAKLEELLIMQDIFYLGKSKTAQYGKCLVKKENIAEVQISKEQWKDTECIVVTLVSDMVLRNRNGFVTPEPCLFIDEIAELLAISPDMLEIERQFLAFTTKSGFSGIWKLPRIQEHALKAGSVIVIKNNSGKIFELGKLAGHCFGIDTREGNGKIKINRRKEEDFKYEKYKQEALSIPPSEELVKIQETIKRVLLEHIKAQLKIDALRKAQSSQLPSNSFLGKIDMFMNQAKTFADLNSQYLSQLRDIGKKQLEKIEEHLFVDVIEKKVEIEKIKKFLIKIKNEHEINSRELRDILKLAKIDEHFFENDEEITFTLYKHYARLFLSSLRLIKRRNDEE